MNDAFTPCLPAHLKPPQHILVDPEVIHSQLTARVLSRLPRTPWSVCRDYQLDLEKHGPDARILYMKNYKGRFMRFCPGTSSYHCCGYRIIHIGENCPLHCSYCILQAYFQDRVLKVWANQQDLFRELEQHLAGEKKLFRAGTGEFTDSLALEAITGYTGDLVAFLGQYPNVCLELKSKIVDLGWMHRVSDPARVLPAWSVNAPEIIASQEKGSSSLQERMQAARECVRQGFRICLHFDPVIHYPGWQKGYARAVEAIFDHVRPGDIAYMSLGSFRFMPELEKILIHNHPGADYIYNEFITGLDGKKRLLLPMRLQQFRFIAEKLKKAGMGTNMYFCMESGYVWKDVLGYTPKDLGGLDKHLLRLSFQAKQPSAPDT